MGGQPGRAKKHQINWKRVNDLRDSPLKTGDQKKMKNNRTALLKKIDTENLNTNKKGEKGGGAKFLRTEKFTLRDKKNHNYTTQKNLGVA